VRVYKTIKHPDQLDLFKWADGEYRLRLFDMPILSLARVADWHHVHVRDFRDDEPRVIRRYTTPRRSPHMGDVHAADFMDVERRTPEHYCEEDVRVERAMSLATTYGASRWTVRRVIADIRNSS
jgi:hypothetical protein